MTTTSNPTTGQPTLETEQVIANLQAVLSKAFMDAFQATPTWYQKITMTQNFDAAGLVLAWLGQVQDLREWIGDRELQSLNTFGYTIEPKDFERTLGFNVNDLTDSIIANAANVFRAIGEAAKRHPQVLVKNLLRTGHLATSLCYDTKPFLAVDHPYKKADGTTGTYANYVPVEGATKRFYLVRGDGNGSTSVVKPFVFGERTGQGYDFKTHGGPASTMEFMKKRVAMGVDARVAAAYGLPQFIACSEKPLSKESLEELAQVMDNIQGDKGVEFENTPNILIVDTDDRWIAEELIETRTKSASDNIHFKRFEILAIKGLKGEMSALVPAGGGE